nr:uncharacterized protein LOC119168168 [Rhipicephalus microplus]
MAKKKELQHLMREVKEIFAGVKLGDSQVETIWKIKTASNDDAMSRSQMNEWYNWFKDGHTLVESEPRSGWPSTRRNDQVIAKVNAVVIRDRCVTIRKIAEEVGINTFSAHFLMIDDFPMKRVAKKFVPKLLMVEQKQLVLKSHRTFWI